MLKVEQDLLLCSSTTEIYAASNDRASLWSRHWSGEVGGSFRPDWWQPDIVVPANAFRRFELEDVYYAPMLGAFARGDGMVPRHGMFQSSYVDPKLERFAALFEKRATAPTLDVASIVVPFGGIMNYGHFLLDGMSTVPYVRGAYLTPPLAAWQREHFKLLRVMPSEIGNLIHVKKATYTSAFGQNLHNPNHHFFALPDGHSPEGSSILGRRLYISRKGQAKREFKSEDILVERLKKFGVVAIQPEAMSINDQIRTFREAELIIAPTGAALANCLYCRPGAKLVEIIPRDMTRDPHAHKWVAYLMAMTGGDWRPYFCENSELDEQMPMLGGIARSGYLSFDADIDDLLSFVESALADRSIRA